MPGSINNPVRLDPFQNIVNIGWRSGPEHILLLRLNAEITFAGETLPPLELDLNYTINGVGGSLSNAQVIKTRTGVEPPHPAILQAVTPEMLAHYAIWSYPPFSLQGSVSNSIAGGFWAITAVHESEGGVLSGVLSDFVAAPYGSLAAAEAYIDSQVELHPGDYTGKFFIISEVPLTLQFSTSMQWRALAFINLRAFPKVQNKWEIEFDLSCPNGAGGFFTFEASLRVGPSDGFLFAADAENVPDLFLPVETDDFVYNSGNGFNISLPDLGGTIVVQDVPQDHTLDTVSGPDGPAGAGEG